MGTKKSGPVGADSGPLVRFGDAMTARTVLDATATAGSFSVVEYVLAPRELAAPLHMHRREDEFTIVIAGRIGFLLGEEVVHAGPGELVREPKNQWHTFWNAGEVQARVLKIISPAGFERYFEEIGSPSPDGPPDLEGMARANRKYGLQMDFESLPQLIERFGLRRPAETDRTVRE
ncbi:cupin domain-containing protein [Arthrobacter sp. NPDC093139]|jgi:mannose-6-phosphate isomerase-like protein (cupin superfamily)|uniref:cupin domain-containing protein n=1 Tax=Arthrobacter sp. NPDC093139 TaxID=3363945 RepID=UPI003806D872